MTNTYAINVTRGKEFGVEGDLAGMGLNPWAPRQLCVKHVKQKKAPVWYDRPYVGKLLFCVFPAVYFRDVCELKHVIGKPVALTDTDMRGVPECGYGPIKIPARPGLQHFKAFVDAEYEEMQRKRQNSDWVCGYTPGQPVLILDGPFEGFEAIFTAAKSDTFGNPEVNVEVDIFGRSTPVSLEPVAVCAA